MTTDGWMDGEERKINFVSFALVVDPNIDETGDQLYKSNSGPSQCCYQYCTNAEGLCSSSCDTIFISNHTAIAPNNSTNRTQSKAEQTPSLFVRLDDGSLVLNDYSNIPNVSMMVCPAMANITPSPQQCSISQAQAVSSAKSLYTLSSSSITSSISVLIQQLIAYLTSYLHLNFPIDYIVASLNSQWMVLVWNLISFSVLRNTLLQLATGL